MPPFHSLSVITDITTVSIIHQVVLFSHRCNLTVLPNQGIYRYFV